MSKKPKKSCKFTSIGGMAVMEGIMMRGPTKTSLGVRLPSGELYVEECRYTSPREKYRVLRLPLIRGVMAFVESMLNGYKVLMRSAELAATEEERTEEQKEKDNKLFAVLSVIATILGFGLAFFLFFFCPTYIFNWIDGITAADLSAFRGLFEGIMKFALFLLYIVLVSMMKEIKRVFMFHGAEHKTIFCYEANEPLTVENCRKFSRFHPRCGTSFMVFMILISILLSSCLVWIVPGIAKLPVLWVAVKILMLPLFCGIGFEIIRYCGKHDNTFTRVVSMPGKWVQRITTREPEDGMLEVAIAALTDVIPENGEDRM